MTYFAAEVSQYGGVILHEHPGIRSDSLRPKKNFSLNLYYKIIANASLFSG